ncbi:MULTISPECIES: HTTM domain-containing protein [unclassified Streptomyces]|uniref:HTTM domain-containing protein n=1 Tax=unclassified Streptomyces TaxID=2593676 RepID=UPI0022515616|nr:MULTISPECIES: HTTM domain-containing protein [unclassified Streptomyces]MCX4408707.1 HTTM domain-containing protein [Streptomyces sp. NBC_01764]MCX5091375.1 HTTM domain-containing protein [Streptomyces sp. NBC_00365]MCX5185952.1 HTTM domain-containing protein [Streptomyces sp. NBC_00268]
MPQPMPDRIGTLFTLLLERPISLYAAAVLRIGYGFLYLAFLLREFPHRNEIWGPGSPWTPALAKQLFDQTGWASILTLSDSRAYFEVCYTAALVTSALFMLGWRTRAVSVLFAVVVTSFHARAIYMTDGGDTLILLMALYLVVTACGRRWSLDARRTRLRASAGKTVRLPLDQASGELRRHLRDARLTVITVLHNCGMLVIAAQVCFLYGSAGLYKVQGASWGNGTALHYALNLDVFQPWPELSALADEHDVLIAITCYLTVLLQVAFPFVLFGRLKYLVLTMLLGMHVGVVVFLGLPLFSGAMIVADAVFLPDRFYRYLGQLWRGTTRRTEAREAGTPSHGEPALMPPQHAPSSQ